MLLKSRKTYECFELKYFILFLMLIPCTWTDESIAHFNVICDPAGLYVKIAFSRPFSGIVYAKGYRFDPLCSMTETSVWDVSLPLPIMACGTYINETKPWITNTVVIQKHNLINTTYNYEKQITCSPEFFEKFWSASLLLDQIYDSHSFPMAKPSPDIELGLNIFREEVLKNIDSRSKYLPIFETQNRTIYNDIGIKSCIIHDAEILARNASINQIINSRGCFTADFGNSSSLKIIRANEGVKVYARIETLEMESLGNIYVTCEVILCKSTCRCSEIDKQLSNYSTAVISHKLAKRSTDTSEDISLKQYEARTRYLKSTVKALMNSIVENRRNIANTPKLKKRTVRLENSSFPFDGNSFVFQAAIANTETFLPESVSTEFSNIKPNLIDIYNFSGNAEFDYNDNGTHSSIEKVSTVNSDLIVAGFSEEFKDNRTKNFSIEKFKDIDRSIVLQHRFYENGTLIVPEQEFSINGTLVDFEHGLYENGILFDPEQIFYENGTLFDPEQEFYENGTLVDTEQEFNEDGTLVDPEQEFYENGTLVDPEQKFYEKGSFFDLEHEIFEKGTLVTRVVPERELQEKGTEVSIEDLQENGTTIVTDDMVSSVSETTENINLENTISRFPTVVHGSRDHHGSCISMLRFIIVLVIMGFVIGVLLLVSCGMALYIKKMQKRHRLDDFLLYSFGF